MKEKRKSHLGKTIKHLFITFPQLSLIATFLSTQDKKAVFLLISTFKYFQSETFYH